VAVLRAVLFDLDDTLVDQTSAARVAVGAWAAEHGVLGPDVAARWEAISDVHYARYQLRELTYEEQRRERVREFFGIEASDAEADELFAGYRERYTAAWALFDDAAPALRRVRAAGLAVGVLTNGDEAHQRFKVEQLGLADHIDELVASSTLPAGKPDRRAFIAAADRLGHAPNQILMVGNSLEHDVHGALAAGLDAVLLDRYDAHAGAAVRRVRSLHELETTRPQ
jgi:putative hydrolase of the HAD superfamily